MPEIVTSTLAVALQGVASEPVAAKAEKVISLWLFTGKLT
jgi:hypothetical protein